MTFLKLPTRRNLIAAVVLGGLILWQLGAFDPRARAPSRDVNVTREQCDRMYEWCIPRECTGSTEWATLKACAAVGYGPPGMPPLRSGTCTRRARDCADSTNRRCSDLEWQYILACDHAGLISWR